jgi:hypothetical protein
MHTVEILEEAIDLAERLGYVVRHEWLGGNGGGGCEVAGQKMLFLDLTQGPTDKLDQVVDTLRREPAAMSLPMPHQLQDVLKLRKSA